MPRHTASITPLPVAAQHRLIKAKRVSPRIQLRPRRRMQPEATFSTKGQPALSPFLYDSTKEHHCIDENWKWSVDDIPAGPQGYLFLEPGARAGYFPRFFENAAQLYTALETELPWIQRHVIYKGQKWMQPRSICYMADAPDLTYTYFQTTNHPVPYTPSVIEVKSKVEAFLKMPFNCVLSNLYKTGGDYMEFHADDEPLFGEDPTIASVSFGLARAFEVRRADSPQIRFRYMLGNGDLFVMEGGQFQQSWEHGVLTEDDITEGRINMTFRLTTDPEPVEQS